MKKILVTLVVGIITLLNVNQTNAQTIYTGDGLWTRHTSMSKLMYEDPSLNAQPVNFKQGYYIFNTDISNVPSLTLSPFERIEAAQNMHLPLISSTTNYQLLYLDNTYEMNSSYYATTKSFFDTMIGINNDDLFCFYSEYPYDTVAPFFITKELTTYTSQNKTIHELLDEIVAYDFTNGDVSGNIAIIKDDYTYDKSPGVKYITLQVNDVSGNVCTDTIKIIIIDDNSPTITAKPMFVSNSYKLSEELILNSINAYDNLGNKIDVEITKESYFENHETSSEYTITVEGVDQFNNHVSIEQKIYVVNSDIPFYTYDCDTLVFDEYIDLNDKQLLLLLEIATPESLDYLTYRIDSRITDTIGEYYVFYELYTENDILEKKLIIQFNASSNSSSTETIEEINRHNYLITTVLISILFVIGANTIISIIKK